MRVVLLGRRVVMVFAMLVLLILITPLIQYFALQLADPLAVHFHEPRGDAVKVVADGDHEQPGRIHRFLLNIREFYQNGL